MCLTSKQKEPLIAKEDIVVYKLVVKDNLPTSPYYYGPTTGFQYRLNKLYEDSHNPYVQYFTSDLSISSITKDWFHSFIDYTTARVALASTRIIDCNECVLLKGIIPKDTYYYL